MGCQSGKVAIVGAGLGGLTAALALHRFGIPVTVFERAPKLAEIGAGITISPNPAKVLYALGLEQEVDKIGTIVPTQGVLHWRTGEVLARNERGDAPRQKFGAPYYQMHRADLHDVLVEAMLKRAPGSIQLDKNLVDIEHNNEGGVTLAFADKTREKFDAVIGADGIRSRVRAVLFGEQKPRFTGRVAWRGLVDANKVDWEPPVSSAMLIGPGKGIGYYPVRNGELYNYLAICRSDEWAVEGWNERSEVSEVLREFDGWYSPIRQVIEQTEPDQCYKWGLFDRPPVERWTIERVTLLGDAAHPMLPYMGQGAAMAIEDGMVMGRALAASDTFEEAFARYEKARHERTRMVQEESALKADRWEAQETRAYSQKTHRNEDTIGLFDYDATTVPI